MSLSCNGLDIHGVCRLCGSEDGIRVSIFEPGTEHVRKIHKILPITVNEHDPFPKNMCHRCSYKVEEFFEFRTNCIKAQEVFKSKVPWLRNKKVQQTTVFNNDHPPMVEVLMNPINSISPNEKQILRRSLPIEENASTIEIDDDSPPCILSNSVTNNENDHNREKIIMKIKKSRIKKKTKRRSMWDIRKRKKKSKKTFRIAEVFTTSLNNDLDLVNENESLEQSPEENKILIAQSPGTNHYYRDNAVLSEEKAIESINLPKCILVTNIPREGNVYTCEKSGRTFLSSPSARLHVCEKNGNTNDSSQGDERVSSSPSELYICEECEQAFTRHSQLVAHKKKHQIMDDSSDDNFKPFKQRKRHHSKMKPKSKLTENSTSPLSLNQSEPTIIKHSLLSSDSE